jgi:hypothetical protein
MSTYERGDYVKVEFPDEATGVGEWMWVRVQRCDDDKRLVFGTLDNVPLNDLGGKLKLGTELAVSFDQIRERREASPQESEVRRIQDATCKSAEGRKIPG